MISYNVDLGNTWTSYFRKYKDMDQNAFRKAVEKRMKDKPFKLKLGRNNKTIDSSVKYIINILVEATEETCTMIKVTHKSKIPWSKELNSLKKRTLKLRSGEIRASSRNSNYTERETEELAEQSKQAEAEHKKALSNADKNAFKEYCSQLEKPKKLAKIPKPKKKPWEELKVNVLKKRLGCSLSTLKRLY